MDAASYFSRIDLWSECQRGNQTQHGKCRRLQYISGQVCHVGGYSHGTLVVNFCMKQSLGKMSQRIRSELWIYYKCTYVTLRIHIHLWICAYIYISEFAHTYTYASLCININMEIYAWICTLHMQIYAQTYTRKFEHNIYICKFAYNVHGYTYPLTYIQATCFRARK